jgi:hypothetical protein
MISSGAWTLFRANALCLVRRLLPLVRANPVIFCLVVLGPVAFLAGLAWAGARDAAAFRHLSSIEGSLDAQIRSAPLSRLEMFLGTVGIPFSACCLAVSVSSLVLLAPLFHAVGARPYAPVQLALFEAAAFYAAGAVGEVFARATRRRPAALLALPLLVLAWVGERSCDRGRGMAWYRWTARAHGHEHRDGAGGGAHARLALSSSPARACGPRWSR